MRLKRVVRADNGELYGYRFDCPGCRDEEGAPETHVIGVGWTFDGDMERPTFSPSVLVTNSGDPKYCCHSFVREGRIQFLGDCSHALAGQTVDLPEIRE